VRCGRHQTATAQREGVGSPFCVLCVGVGSVVVTFGCD
jgi:hypothetical protein